MKRNILFASVIAAAAILLMALFVLVISPKLVEPADTYSNALKLINEGEYMRAALKLETIKSYSNSTELASRAWKLAGDTAYNEGRYDEASACYTKAGADEEDLARVDECFVHLAKRAFNGGDVPRGEIYLSCVKHPESISDLLDEARLLGAKRLLQQGSDKSTVDSALGIVSLCSDSAHADISNLFKEFAFRMLDDLNIEPAYTAFSAAKRYCPESELRALANEIHNAWGDAGRIAMDRGDRDTAKKCFDYAGEPDDPENDGTDEERYALALGLYNRGDYAGALKILKTLDDSFENTGKMKQDILARLGAMPAAGDSTSYAILNLDGTVKLVGSGWGTTTVNWSGVRQIAVGDESFILALRADGTVVGAGVSSTGRLDVTEWTNIVAIACGKKHSIGLRADGTVAACGWDMYGQRETGFLANIVAIAAGANTSYAVSRSGRVYAIGDNSFGQCDVSEWQDIVAVAAGRAHAVGLRSDGTVVACGDNTYGQCGVSAWMKVKAISCGTNHTVALLEDGTLVACGSNTHGECSVSGIRNAVAVSCGEGYTIVVLEDGTYQLLGSFDGH